MNVWVLSPTVWDSFMRLIGYVRAAQARSRNLITQLQGAADDNATRAIVQQAVEGRNKLLERFRGRIFPFGRAFSIILKDEGLSVEAALNRYTGRILVDEAALTRIFAVLLEQGVLTEEARRDLYYHFTGEENTDPIMSPNGVRDFTDAVRNLDRQTMLNRINECQGRQCYNILQRVRGSDIVARRVVEASGRTRKWVNVLSGFIGGTATLAIMSGGVITIVYLAGGCSLPRSVMDVFGAVGVTPRTLVSGGGQLAGSLAGQFTLDAVAGGRTCCVRRYRTNWDRSRGCLVFSMNIIWLLILWVLITFLLGPMVSDHWGDRCE